MNTGQNVGGFPMFDISATRAWDVTQGDTSVVIGILDTGMDWTHPDLAANVLRNPRD